MIYVPPPDPKRHPAPSRQAAEPEAPVPEEGDGAGWLERQLLDIKIMAWARILIRMSLASLLIYAIVAVAVALLAVPVAIVAAVIGGAAAG